MQFASTGALANALIYFTSTGDLFAAPASSTSVNQKWVVADRHGVTYLGIDLEPARVSGASTGPLILLVSSLGVGTTLYYGGILYSDIVTNGANYLYMLGTAAGGTPGLAAFGADTDIDVVVQPKGAGALRTSYAAVANGGGAAPTLGTIGGSGPGTAGQAGWLQINAGSTGKKYFVAVWST